MVGHSGLICAWDFVCVCGPRYVEASDCADLLYAMKVKTGVHDSTSMFVRAVVAQVSTTAVNWFAGSTVLRGREVM
jgi:hypothetical protein